MYTLEYQRDKSAPSSMWQSFKYLKLANMSPFNHQVSLLKVITPWLCLVFRWEDSEKQSVFIVTSKPPHFPKWPKTISLKFSHFVCSADNFKLVHSDLQVWIEMTPRTHLRSIFRLYFKKKHQTDYIDQHKIVQKLSG